MSLKIKPMTRALLEPITLQRKTCFVIHPTFGFIQKNPQIGAGCYTVPAVTFSLKNGLSTKKQTSSLQIMALERLGKNISWGEK